MTIKIEIHDRVALVMLNRPEKHNALSSALLVDLVTALTPLDRDPAIGCFVLTGSNRVFAAGADITEMAEMSYQQMAAEDYFCDWDDFARLRTPVIAAVSGYALGGGCELAMMCDTIFASESALFGQPEITIGVIPGMGGSQRLTKLVGKAKAMDMILTGRMMDATEAERSGLVSRVIPEAELLPEALEAAKTIASYSKPAVMQAKESVQRAEHLPLSEGVRFERRAFHALFATEDQKEGMRAFREKRNPKFIGR